MKKSLKWEFWPFWLFYIPVYVHWLWYSLKSRSLVFFSAANPTMNLGGFSAYSKYQVLDLIPTKVVPAMFLLQPSQYEKANKLCNQHKISFPLIAKPDLGERGFGVALITSETELNDYLTTAKNDIIIQEYIDFPIELGIMYHRLPGEKKGHITSVVSKEFLTVTGDGQSTLIELFKQGKRTYYHFEMLCIKYHDKLKSVLPKNKKIQLQEIGNHSRGTTFLNANHLINDKLHEVFDAIAIEINGFYFGRFDLRVSSIEHLYEGEQIKIMELNGAASEPAHIYDPEMKILAAYKALFSHWKNLYLVSKKNKEKGHHYTPFLKAYKQHMNYFKTR